MTKLEMLVLGKGSEAVAKQCATVGGVAKVLNLAGADSPFRATGPKIQDN